MSISERARKFSACQLKIACPLKTAFELNMSLKSHLFRCMRWSTGSTLWSTGSIVVDWIDKIGVMKVRMPELSDELRRRCISRGMVVHVRFFVSSSLSLFSKLNSNFSAWHMLAGVKLKRWCFSRSVFGRKHFLFHFIHRRLHRH